MAEADYLVLKERVAATSWIRKAMEDLKHLGAKLTRELNQRRRVASRTGGEESRTETT